MRLTSAATVAKVTPVGDRGTFIQLTRRLKFSLGALSLSRATCPELCMVDSRFRIVARVRSHLSLYVLIPPATAGCGLSLDKIRMTFAMSQKEFFTCISKFNKNTRLERSILY